MPRAEERVDDILGTTIRILETEGHEAVQVRRVAADAAVSLATIYKLYGSRDELIVCALERWMAQNAYADVDDIDEQGDRVDALVTIIRRVYAPWVDKPHMLAAFVHARSTPGGRRLDTQGFDRVMPTVLRLLEGIDPDLFEDLLVVLQHVNLGTLARFADGEIAVTEIGPILERATRRVLAPARPGGSLAEERAPAGPRQQRNPV